MAKHSVRCANQLIGQYLLILGRKLADENKALMSF